MDAPKEKKGLYRNPCFSGKKALFHKNFLLVQKELEVDCNAI